MMKSVGGLSLPENSQPSGEIANIFQRWIRLDPQIRGPFRNQGETLNNIRQLLRNEPPGASVCVYQTQSGDYCLYGPIRDVAFDDPNYGLIGRQPWRDAGYSDLILTAAFVKNANGEIEGKNLLPGGDQPDNETPRGGTGVARLLNALPS